MGSVYFYPRLTDEMLKNAGCMVSDYSFSYDLPPSEARPLELRKGRVCSLMDPADMWRLRSDGLSFQKRVVIEYPERLKGPNGVVPEGASLLPCVLWTSRKMSITGVVFPEIVSKAPTVECLFEKKFEPGALAGDVELELVMYVSDAAETVGPGEGHLMNTPGVILGQLEEPISIDFDGKITDFPIEEIEDTGGPLWQVRFEPWDDPREDMFSAESFTLFLNIKHPECPRINSTGITNKYLLQEILAGALFLLFEKVYDFSEDRAVWKDTMNGSNLVPGSICSVLHWLSQKGEEAFDWSTPERRMLSIKRIVDQSFAVKEGE